MDTRFTKILKLMVISGLFTTFLFSQTMWDNGSMDFNYGNFVPSSSWGVNGSIIPDGVGEGAGGFMATSNDSSTLVAMGYQTTMVDSSLIGDLFLVTVRDSGLINTRSYTINPIANLATALLWLPHVSGDFLMEVISGNISTDSLMNMNIRIATTGTITVSQISETDLGVSFQGVLFDPTTFETFVIANGAVALENSLPTPDYIAGGVNFDFNGSSFDGSGNFNPLLDDAGSGGVTTYDGDTLNYSLLSFHSQGPDDFDIFGLTVRTLEPLTSGTVNIAAPGTVSTYPQAQAFYLQNGSLADLYLLLQNPSMETLGSLSTTDIYGAISGQVTFTRSTFNWDGTFSGQLVAMGPIPVIIPLTNGEFNLTLQPYVGVTDETVVAPNTFTLGANYPNPFNPSTRIPFNLPEGGKIRLEIFDLAGRSVETLLNGMATAGEHSVNWQPTEIASGVYLVRLTQGTQTSSRKLMFLK